MRSPAHQVTQTVRATQLPGRVWVLGFHTELRHETKGIREESRLRDLAMFNRQQVEAGPLHVVPSRWDTLKNPSMRPLDRVPDTNFVSLGDGVINRYVQIREADQMSAHARLQAITPNSLAVDGELFGEELIDHEKILPVEAFFYPPMNEGLVLGADAFRPVDSLAVTAGNDC
jgi:hypothetical protein